MTTLHPGYFTAGLDADPELAEAIRGRDGVELVEQEGLRFMTNLVNCDPESVSIGMPVRVLFEDHGEIFVPVFEPDPTG